MDEDTFGEFYLTQYLDQHLDSSQSSAAADGWGGDLYAVYYNESNGQLVMLLNIVWDTSFEAGEFAEAYRQFGTARAASEPTTASAELTCWTALDYLCMWHSQAQTLIFLAPDRATLQPLLAQYNITN